MADSPETSAAKKDGEFLRGILGIHRDDNHAECRLCKKKNLRCKPDRNGEYRWECFSGCGKGTCVDALMIYEKKSLKEAMSVIFKTYGNGSPTGVPAQDRHTRQMPREEESQNVRWGTKRPEPVLDLPRAEEFVAKSHEYLVNNFDLVEHFKRGISMDVVKKFRLGFIENVPIKFRPWDKGAGWNIPASWVLPVTDVEGKLKGVKLHFEIRPMVRGNPDKGEPPHVPCQGKSRWAPFGTEPNWDREKNIAPVHAYYGLWPHPDSLDDPALGEEFSSSIGWWINRIPPGPLKDKWYSELEWAKSDIAYDLSKTTDTLDDGELGLAVDRVFSKMRDEIFRAVGKKPTETAESDTPEPIQWRDYVFITPGELKAFAILSAGYRATAVTSGENWIPPMEVLACFKGVKVCIFYDDDPPSHDPQGRTRWPGRAWAKQLAMALIRVGARAVVLLSGGQRDGRIPEEDVVGVPL